MVVIIDDSDDFLVSAAGLLNEEGFVVVGCVADPATAVETVRRLRPSVVLLESNGQRERETLAISLFRSR